MERDPVATLGALPPRTEETPPGSPAGRSVALDGHRPPWLCVADFRWFCLCQEARTYCIETPPSSLEDHLDNGPIGPVRVVSSSSPERETTGSWEGDRRAVRRAPCRTRRSGACNACNDRGVARQRVVRLPR